MSRREEETIDTREAWTAPVVRRLSAGSAEDGGGPSADAGQPS
jgi:hypothetical protein